MATRAPRQGRGRVRLAKSYQAPVPALTWTMSIVANKLRVTTGLPYVFVSIPKVTVQGVTPTAFTNVSATSFDLTYAANVVTTNVVVVPQSDPGIRGQVGGYLNAGTVTL